MLQAGCKDQTFALDTFILYRLRMEKAVKQQAAVTPPTTNICCSDLFLILQAEWFTLRQCLSPSLQELRHEDFQTLPQSPSVACVISAAQQSASGCPLTGQKGVGGAQERPILCFPKPTSPEQCGRDPLQRPSSWHMRVELPTRVRFPRQLYRTTEPTVYLSPEI